jgi:hypothetical protein
MLADFYIVVHLAGWQAGVEESPAALPSRMAALMTSASATTVSFLAGFVNKELDRC